MMNGQRPLPFSAATAGPALVVVPGENVGPQTAKVDLVPAALGIAAGAIACNQLSVGPADRHQRADWRRREVFFKWETGWSARGAMVGTRKRRKCASLGP